MFGLALLTGIIPLPYLFGLLMLLILGEKVNPHQGPAISSMSTLCLSGKIALKRVNYSFLCGFGLRVLPPG